jgi:hypothetical protein
VAKKSGKTDRQKVIDDLRKKQKGAERRRGYAIVGVCGLVAVLIVGAAAYSPVKGWYDLRQFDGTALSSIGGPASDCQPRTKKDATGSSQHEATGTQITYTTAPPAFGPHWNEANVAPAPFNRKFYTSSDRPELESLVHNLEHGYTILWYDETAADDSGTMSEIEAIADKFRASDQNFRFKFVAAPWTADDEKESGKFPDGQHIAFTHWSAKGGPDQPQGSTAQKGIFQYCSDVSGAALESFMTDYPYTDSPEPNAI